MRQMQFPTLRSENIEAVINPNESDYLNIVNMIRTAEQMAEEEDIEEVATALLISLRDFIAENPEGFRSSMKAALDTIGRMKVINDEIVFVRSQNRCPLNRTACAAPNNILSFWQVGPRRGRRRNPAVLSDLITPRYSVHRC